MATSIQLHIPDAPSPLVRKAADLLLRTVAERTVPAPVTPGAGGLRVELAIEPGIGTEGFRIDDIPAGIRVSGNDERGLLYGVGKLLHGAAYRPGEFIPGGWRGASVPAKTVRGIYFATHFHNWYHEAPIADVTRYIEELALWGFNVLNVWFDMHHYRGIGDPEAQAMIARLHAMLQAANAVGMGACLGFLANEAYADSPEAMRADWTAGHDGYHTPPGGHYHVELCPSQPGAMETLLRWTEEKLEAFADIDLEYLWVWPYDQGGCTCGRCAPWGTNGFLRLAEPIARQYRARFPGGKVVLSTWYFDHFTAGEWEGLDRAFRRRPDWVDYLLVDDYGDHFPAYPLAHGAPGGFPMVNFPEISMYAAGPWGGYGANPFPCHLQAIWDAAGARLDGGFPYSEGIYEDLNKIICAGFYWDGGKAAAESAREYAAYHFGPEFADDIVAAVTILEETLPRGITAEAGEPVVSLGNTAGVDSALQRLEAVARQLAPGVQASWRWRLLYLRARIDAELAREGGRISDRCEEAFRELAAIYQADRACNWVRPPVREVREEIASNGLYV